MSFSILNIKELLNSLYGQFTTSIFRGSENCFTLKNHGQAHFDELDNLARNGITVELINGAQEHFNIVIFLVADLGYIKDIIGKCSSTALYGCYHCIKKIQDWHAGVLNLSKP